jgi:hypothetical protein
MRRMIFLLLFAGLFACQPLVSQVVTVRIGNSIYKARLKDGVKNKSAYMNVFNVAIGEDGIITKVGLAGEADVLDPFKIVLTRKGDAIVIKRSAGSVHEIRWSGNALELRGPLFVGLSNKALKVSVAGKKDEIYASPELVLQSKDGELNEIFRKKPSDFFAFRYSNSVLFVDYRMNNNTQFKLEYKNEKGKNLAKYFAAFDEDFLEYSPPIEISGARLCSNSTLVNVINYFILKASDNVLEEALFPLLFLPNAQGE